MSRILHNEDGFEQSIGRNYNESKNEIHYPSHQNLYNNISQAQITITELLGFNPITVAKNDGVSNDAKKLIVLLTAVSQMAKDGALGCTSGAAADKTKCVINALAAGTSSTGLKLETRLGSQTFNVSCVIATAISKTLQDAKFQSQSPLLAQVLNKFKCG